MQKNNSFQTDNHDIGFFFFYFDNNNNNNNKTLCFYMLSKDPPPPPPSSVLQHELERVQNFSYETRIMAAILKQLTWESLIQQMKQSRFISLLYTRFLRVNPVCPRMALFIRTSLAEICTRWLSDCIVRRPIFISSFFPEDCQILE